MATGDVVGTFAVVFVQNFCSIFVSPEILLFLELFERILLARISGFECRVDLLI